MQNQRKRVWIDRFQTTLVVRLLFYAIAYQVSLWIIIYTLRVCWSSMEAVTDSPSMTHLGMPAVLAICALMALLAVDAVRYVHRLVGPLYRFRKTVEAINAGEPVDLIRLRKDDFLKDLAVEFNKMMELMEQRGALSLKEGKAAEKAVEVAAH